MKWKQRKLHRDCASQPLVELIRDELDEKQCKQLASHLDECETCQQRLTVLAADSQWWLDAGRWLDPAAGGIDPCNDNLEHDFYEDDDAYSPDPVKELLASGLLRPSDRASCLGTIISKCHTDNNPATIKTIDPLKHTRCFWHPCLVAYKVVIRKLIVNDW